MDDKFLERFAAFLSEGSVYDRLFVIYSGLCSPDISELLATDSSNDVRAAVARLPKASVSALTVLSKDATSWVRRCVAANWSTPPEVLAVLSEDSASDVASAATYNPGFDPGFLGRFSKKFRAGALLRVVADPASTEKMLGRVVGEYPSDGVLCKVAGHPNVSVELLDRLVDVGGPDVWVAVCASSRVSAEVLFKIWAMADVVVRRSVLLSSVCPPELLRDAAASSVWVLRDAALSNECLPPDVFDSFLRSAATVSLLDSESLRALAAVVSNPACPAHLRDVVLSSGSDFLKGYAAFGVSLDPSLLPVRLQFLHSSGFGLPDYGGVRTEVRFSDVIWRVVCTADMLIKDKEAGPLCDFALQVGAGAGSLSADNSFYAGVLGKLFADVVAVLVTVAGFGRLSSAKKVALAKVCADCGVDFSSGVVSDRFSAPVLPSAARRVSGIDIRR